jgi:hypothetical protein
VSSPDDPHSSPARGAAAGARRFLSRRTLWHTVGLAVALALAWLLFRAYRQPEFMIDMLSAVGLC